MTCQAMNESSVNGRREKGIDEIVNASVKQNTS